MYSFYPYFFNLNYLYLCRMSISQKNLREILEKLNIEQLNPMQEEAQLVIESNSDIILLSPTGTGKTLAFLLPVIAGLDADSNEVQVLILVPSRELAIQIEQVIREMGTGFKTNAVYGGRAGSQDKIDLKHRPAILIGTPGRIADHFRKESFPTEQIHTLILDEFDKSLEIGFESEMIEIVDSLPNLKKRILTSATQRSEIPAFVGLRNPAIIDYLHEKISDLTVKTILSPGRDKRPTLVDTIHHLGNQPGIVFCNFKDTIQEVSDFLLENNIGHGCFHGGMEQQDRERSLIKFRNGTYQIIVATDLAARGIDVPEIKFIIHYQLPKHDHEFIHRNGRTARMHSEGTAFVLISENEYLPDFIRPDQTREELVKQDKGYVQPVSTWETLYVTGGRRDKISKGDIAGLFLKQAGLENEELGLIEIKQDCAFVAVKAQKADEVIRLTNNSKLKKKKVRVSLI